jgi:hypothetical protein
MITFCQHRVWRAHLTPQAIATTIWLHSNASSHHHNTRPQLSPWWRVYDRTQSIWAWAVELTRRPIDRVDLITIGHTIVANDRIGQDEYFNFCRMEKTLKLFF